MYLRLGSSAVGSAAARDCRGIRKSYKARSVVLDITLFTGYDALTSTAKLLASTVEKHRPSEGCLKQHDNGLFRNGERNGGVRGGMRSLIHFGNLAMNIFS